jgi:hypothetical protein
MRDVAGVDENGRRFETKYCRFLDHTLLASLVDVDWAKPTRDSTNGVDEC